MWSLSQKSFLVKNCPKLRFFTVAFTIPPLYRISIKKRKLYGEIKHDKRVPSQYVRNRPAITNHNASLKARILISIAGPACRQAGAARCLRDKSLRHTPPFDSCPKMHKCIFSRGHIEKTPVWAFSLYVPSAGIEPTLRLPQSRVLSVERRGDGRVLRTPEKGRAYARPFFSIISLLSQ